MPINTCVDLGHGQNPQFLWSKDLQCAFVLISHLFYKAKLFIHFKDLFFRFGVWILVVKNLHAFVVRVRSLTLGDGRPISSLRTPLTLLAQADLSLVLKSHSCSICCCFRIFRPLCYFYTFWLESDAYEQQQTIASSVSTLDPAAQFQIQLGIRDGFEQKTLSLKIISKRCCF